MIAFAVANELSLAHVSLSGRTLPPLQVQSFSIQSLAVLVYAKTRDTLAFGFWH